MEDPFVAQFSDTAPPAIAPPETVAASQQPRVHAIWVGAAATLLLLCGYAGYRFTLAHPISTPAPASPASAIAPTTVLDDAAHNFHARPSPDGRWIAFDSDRDGTRAVYVMDRNGGQVRRMSGDGFAAIPSWSPDMRWLAFVRAETSRPHVWNLWLRNIASGELTRISTTPVPGRLARTPAASPDGSRVVFQVLGDGAWMLDPSSGAMGAGASG